MLSSAPAGPCHGRQYLQAGSQQAAVKCPKMAGCAAGLRRLPHHLQRQQHHTSLSGATAPPRQRPSSVAAAAKPTMVLESQPMLSDIVTDQALGPWATVFWKVTLDIVLPIVALVALLKLVDWAADQARAEIDARVAGDRDVVEELQRKSTLSCMVLLAMRTPAKFLLPPWLFAYTFRTALNIVDLVVNKYKPKLPQLLDQGIKQISAQLVPLDAALQTLLSISGILFVTWFAVKLKDILIREVILVRAIRSGNKELERVYLPLSSLVTWAAVLASAVSVCSSLGICLKPVLAVGGAGGIAAGFASQQLLLNVVAGVNIFLTRPFISGDQVVFEGGANVEGTVEGVEITRTLLRTADGTLVALPNKLVSDLIVYNRTRALESAPKAVAGAGSSSAPLRRVLCFTLQLGREHEADLDAIRADVGALLNAITKEQLVASGLAPDPSTASVDAAKASNGNGNGNGAGGNGSGSGNGNGKALKSTGKGALDAVPAAAAAAAAAAVLERSSSPSSSQAGKATSEADAADAAEASPPPPPEPEPLAVSVTLKQLTETQISLFVRCEMLLPGASMMNAVERQTEKTLIAISGLVKEKYDASLLWC